MPEPTAADFGGVNPLLVIAQLKAFSAAKQREADDLNAGLRQSAGVAHNQLLRLTVLGGRMVDAEFLPAAGRATPTQLRIAVRDLYASAAAYSANAMANAVAAVAGDDAARVMRESAPESVQIAAEALELEHEPGRIPGPDAADLNSAWDELDGFLDDPALDSIDAWEAPEKTFAAEGYNSVKHFDSHDWQADLDREVAQIMASTEGLKERLHSIVAEAGDRYLRVRVRGTGILEDANFAPAATSLDTPQLSERLIALYAEACADAQAQVEEAFSENGGTPGWWASDSN